MSRREISFRGGARTVLWFAAAVAVWAVVFVSADAAVADSAAWIQVVEKVVKFAVLAAIAWRILRLEGVELADLGASRQYVGPAIVAFAGLWLAVNLVGIGVAALAGNEWAVSLIWHPPEGAVEQFGALPAPWLAVILLQFLVVGVVEEFVLRGYFQTKVIALLGDGTRLRIALGVVTASVVFGALHTPGALLATGSLEAALGAAALPAITGVFFGAFYELTRNVYFVAALHGLGNTWPIAVEWQNWSGNALVAFFVGVAIVYLGATFGYRYWVRDTELTPTADREDVESVGVVG